MTKAHAILLTSCCLLLSAPAVSLEKLSDDQLSEVQAKGANWTFENIEFRGTEGPKGEAAGFIRSEGTDGSSLKLDRFHFSAAEIGTEASPHTTGSVLATGVDHASIGERNYLRIGFPELEAWKDVDLSFEAIYGNPEEHTKVSNPELHMDGATVAESPSSFGGVTLNNLKLAGCIDIAGIPDGYKIEAKAKERPLVSLPVFGGIGGESVKNHDGSVGAPSREGILLNVNIEKLTIDELLFQPGGIRVDNEDNPIYTEASDLAIRDFTIENLNLTSATIETTPFGWRFAYSDPLSFGGDGLPDQTIPESRQAQISFETQMPHGLPSTSRITNFTVDHLVFSMSNGTTP